METWHLNLTRSLADVGTETRTAARNLKSHITPLNMLAPPSWRFLVALAAVRKGIKPDEVLGRSRFEQIVLARHQAIILIYTHTGWSMCAVARRMQLDHSTIHHVLHKYGVARQRIAVNREIIREGYRLGTPVIDIATQCGSTPRSVRVTANRMGLVHRNMAKLSLPDELVEEHAHLQSCGYGSAEAADMLTADKTKSP